MQTIAQQLNVTEFPFVIRDSKGNEIYFENSDGLWKKYEYDSKGNLPYYENSTGYWEKREYDSKGNVIYYKDSDGYWSKREYDSNGKEIYYKDSDGYIIDNRPKKEVVLTLDQIAEKFGCNVKDLKIKK